MIKSRIDARERAVELAIKFSSNRGFSFNETLDLTIRIERYLIGDAYLPETDTCNSTLHPQMCDYGESTF